MKADIPSWPAFTYNVLSDVTVRAADGTEQNFAGPIVRAETIIQGREAVALVPLSAAYKDAEQVRREIYKQFSDLVA